MTEIDWSFDAERRLLRVRYSGTLRVEFFARIAEIRREIGVAPGEALVLIDGRDADLSELTADDFKELERMRAEIGLVNDRAAGVLGREIDLGIGQLWAMFRNRSQAGTTAVFLTERDALDWLFAED